MKDRKLLVLGMGISGSSAAAFLLSQGATVFAYDEKVNFWETDQNLQSLKNQDLFYFDINSPQAITTFDAIIVSPGVSPRNILYQKAVEAGIEIIGEAELACRYISTPCIGVTGTNGKTTVTLLVAHVLNHYGIAAEAVGNIGVPLTSLISRKETLDRTLLVIELSSYQLETLKSKVLDAALLLNITPDHLERHQSMEGYAAAKARIFDCLKPEGRGYVSARCRSEWKDIVEKSSLRTFDDDQVFLEKLRQSRRQVRSHDAANYLAAYAVCSQWGISDDQFIASIGTFIKPPHRMEWVRSIAGINYVDDSKGTNIDAVIKAVESVEGPIVLIAGGVDKGFSYDSWIAPFADKVRFICTIGAAAEKMHNELSSGFPVQRFDRLEEAVLFASKLAEKGDTVLLSPGCASYDMFTDFAHRGREFKRIVHELI